MGQQKLVVIKPHWHGHPRPKDEEVLEVVRLYNEGWTMREISKKIGRSPSGVHRWLHEYAPLIVNKDMKTNDNNGKGDKRVADMSSEKPKRVTG